MSTQIVTANRLVDGIVVYLAPGDVWSLRIAEAEVAEDKDGAAALLARAEAPAHRTRVVGPYLMDATQGPDGLAAASIREQIRAQGPSVGTDDGPRAVVR